MEAMKEHTIPFTGLKDGVHTYRFELGDEFFTLAGEEEFEGGRVAVDVKLDKSPALLVVDLHAEGPVTLRCDHCNAPMEYALKGDQRQIFQLNGEEDMDDDELVGLPAGAHSLELTHYIYECLRLSLPARHVHPAGQCDPEVEAVLQQLNVDHEPLPDPRWEALKDLKNPKRP